MIEKDIFSILEQACFEKIIISKQLINSKKFFVAKKTSLHFIH